MANDKYEKVVSFITENQEHFYRLAYSYAHNQADALDIVQNAICKALDNYSKLRNVNAVKTWFYQILNHEAFTYLKKRKSEFQMDNVEQLVEDTNPPMEDADNDEEEKIERMYENIARFPYEIQQIIKLRFFEEMSLEEIAAIMEMNLSSVKSKLYRTLSKLKIRMEDESL